jgi:hypothetical protein
MREKLASALLTLVNINGWLWGVATGLLDIAVLIYLGIQGEWSTFVVVLIIGWPIIAGVTWLACMITGAPMVLLARRLDRPTYEARTDQLDYRY